MSDLTPPPHAVGAEKSVLSSILQNPVENLPRALEVGFTPEIFYTPAHSRLFEIFIEKHRKGEVIEFLSLTQDLLDRELLDTMGGPSGLTEIYTYAPTSAHFESHAKIVMEKAILRAIIRFGTKIIGQAYENTDIADLIPQIELGALTIGKEAESRTSYDYSLKAAYKELMDFLNSEESQGIPTGFSEVDAVTGGLHGSEVIVIGARPAIGKTAFAISLAENLAIHQGIPTALFAVEGKRSYLTTRLLAVTSFVSAKRIRDKQLLKEDMMKITRRIKATEDKPLKFDDRISNAVEIAAKIRRLHQENPLKVVIIDYAQKLPAALPEERSNLRLRIINATNILHETCKALDIALVLLAQLNREGDQEHNPTTTALKESGSLEQDADTILLLGNISEDESTEGIQKKLIRIAKNRHGPCADLQLNFNPTTTKFY